MNFTPVGIFTLLGCLALPFLRTQIALLLVAFASFIGSYAIGGDGGGLHILPGPLLALVCCGCIVLRRMFHAPRLAMPMIGRKVLILLMLYAVAVTVIAPTLLAGKVMVIQPNLVSEEIRGAVPLQRTSSSLAQLTYLLFSAVLLMQAARMAQGPRFSLERVVNIFLTMASVMAALVVLETALGAVGVPIDIFGWLMGSSFFEPRPDRYALEGVFGISIRRAQAVFGEPSFYATFMTGAAGAALILQRAKPTGSNLLRYVLIAAGLVAAFSTTAMVGLAAVSTLAVLTPLGVQRARIKAGHGRRGLVLFAFLVVALGLAVAIASSDRLFDYLFGKLTDVSGYEDGNYSSGAERLFWDLTALQAFVDSYGIGIGAGATRASSFVVNTAASVGLPGLLALLALGWTMLRALFRKAAFTQDTGLRAALTMWLGWFFAMALSIPDGISYFYVWIMAGIALSALGTERAKARQAARLRKLNAARPQLSFGVVPDTPQQSLPAA